MGGGQAVQIHGMGARPSEDVDLFCSRRGSPTEVAEDVISGYERHGLQVTVGRRTPDLVQMIITDSNGQSCKVDLGVFWQANSPVVLDIGPVLHPDDVVAGKMDALFNRWAPRDFLDVDAILASGRYTRDQWVARTGGARFGEPRLPLLALRILASPSEPQPSLDVQARATQVDVLWPFVTFSDSIPAR